MRYEVPAGATGTRRRPWAGPYATKTIANTELRRLPAEVDSGLSVPDRQLKVREYLQQWLAGKKRLKPSTQQSYREVVDLYATPLGHLGLAALRENHLDDLVRGPGADQQPARRGGAQRDAAAPPGRTGDRRVAGRGPALLPAAVAGAVALLKAWRIRRKADRLRAGAAWVESERVFTRRNGEALREEYASQRFEILVRRSGLPPIRFHDLRHSAASLMPAAGVAMKVVSETLGHSKFSFTADVYTSVIPEVAEAAAEATPALIPRRPRQVGS